VGAGEGGCATKLGRERAEGRIPRWTELGGANGGAARYLARASRSGRLLWAIEKRRGSTGERSLSLSGYGGGTGESRRRQRRRWWRWQHASDVARGQGASRGG
jgi:hypothetical protein